MIKRALGKSGIEASAIGLGTWAIGGGEWWGDSDDEKSIETIRKAVEAGITLIDTAPCYGFGKSETVVGKALKGIRDKVILSTKCGLWWNDERGSFFFAQDGHNVNRCLEPDTIKREVEMSLKRLDTDYLDVYFTHWQSVPPYVTPISKTMECLMDLKRQGIIRCIGASNVEKEHIDEYLKYGELDVIQEKYSMLDRSLETRLIDSCLKNNLAFMAYSPLEQGLLTGKITMESVFDEKEKRSSIPWMKPVNRIKVINMLDSWSDLTKKYNCTTANLVVAWSMNQPGMSHILCGARKPEHILETAASANVALTAEELKRMRDDVIALGDPE